MADVGAAGVPAEGPVGPGGGPEAKDSVAGWRVEDGGEVGQRMGGRLGEGRRRLQGKGDWNEKDRARMKKCQYQMIKYMVYSSYLWQMNTSNNLIQYNAIICFSTQKN